MNNTGAIKLMIVQMALYGIQLGIVAGFFVTWVTMTLRLTSTSGDILMSFIMAALPACAGSFMGAIYGGIAGLLSGCAMGTITALVFEQVHDKRRFKWVMGGITALIASVVFIAGELWLVGNDPKTGIGVVVMCVILMVEGSQIVARLYLPETRYHKTW